MYLRSEVKSKHNSPVQMHRTEGGTVCLLVHVGVHQS